MLQAKYFKDRELKLLEDDTLSIEQGKNVETLKILQSLQISNKLGISPCVLPVGHKKGSLFEDEVRNKKISKLINEFIDMIRSQTVSFAVYTKNNCLIKSYDGCSSIPLNEGTDWSERYIGTNSADLAIKYKKNFTLVGKQHYAKFLHSFVSFAVPVLYNGQIMGALAIFMPLGCENRMAKNCLNLLVKSIEGQIHICEFENKVSAHICWEEVIIDTISEGFFLLTKKKS